MATLAASVRRQSVIPRKTTLGWIDAQTALAAGSGGQSGVLGEAPFFVRHTFATLPGNRALFFRIHRGKTTTGFSGDVHKELLYVATPTYGVAQLNGAPWL